MPETTVWLLGAAGREMRAAWQQLGVAVLAHSQTLFETPAELFAIIEKERPDIIVPITANPMITDWLVAIERSQLARVVPTPQVIRLTHNRSSLREWVTKCLEIPTSRYAFARSFNELQMKIGIGIGYPCLVKPNSFVTKGQFLVTEPQEVKIAWEYAQSKIPQELVMVESVVDFNLHISLLIVRAREASGTVATYFCEPIGHFHKEQDYLGSWQPQQMATGAWQKAHNIAKKLTDTLGGVGLFEVELFVKGDQVWFSKLSLYPTEKSLLTLVSQTHQVFELHARSILGLPVSPGFQKPSASIVIALHQPVDNVESLVFPETKIFWFDDLTRLGLALATGRSTQEARQRATLAANQIMNSNS